MDAKLKLVKEIESLIQIKKDKEFELEAIKRRIVELKKALYGKV